MTSDIKEIIKEHPNDALSFLRQTYGGQPLWGGVFFFLKDEDVEAYTSLADGYFPNKAGKYVVFGYDWCGNMYAASSDEKTLLVLDPAEDELHPLNGFFLDNLYKLFSAGSESFRGQLYEQWLIDGGKRADYGNCISYKVPFYLGGRDTLSNMSYCAMEIYWYLYAQIANQVRDLPDGTPVRITGLLPN